MGIGYRRVAVDSWRFVDANTDEVVGPNYLTKEELLADIERFARHYTEEK